MFIYSCHKKQLINVAHIVKMYIDAPCFEQRDFAVYASLSFGQGTICLHRGTAENCAEYLKNFMKEVQNNG